MRMAWNSQCEFPRDFVEESTPTNTMEDPNVISEELEEKHTHLGFRELMDFLIVELKR